MLVPDRSADTNLRRTCPWCGRDFNTPRAMQAHEPQCPRWGRPEGDEMAEPAPEATVDLSDGVPIDPRAEDDDAEPDHRQIPDWDPDDTADDPEARP